MRTWKLMSLFLGVFLSACAIKEMTNEFDTVTGGNFIAPLNRYPGDIPTRVMVLPVTGYSQPLYKNIFLNDLMATMHQGRDFLVVPYQEGFMAQQDLKISEADAIKRASAMHCDSVLYMSVQNQQVYPPLRVTIKVLMTDLRTGKIVLDGMLDYDVQNELVANSARRFYQSRLQRTEAPEKSMSILTENQLFLRYVGYDVGKAVLRAFSQDLN